MHKSFSSKYKCIGSYAKFDINLRGNSLPPDHSSYPIIFRPNWIYENLWLCMVWYFDYRYYFTLFAFLGSKILIHLLTQTQILNSKEKKNTGYYHHYLVARYLLQWQGMVKWVWCVYWKRNVCLIENYLWMIVLSSDYYTHLTLPWNNPSIVITTHQLFSVCLIYTLPLEDEHQRHNCSRELRWSISAICKFWSIKFCAIYIGFVKFHVILCFYIFLWWCIEHLICLFSVYAHCMWQGNFP